VRIDGHDRQRRLVVGQRNQLRGVQRTGCAEQRLLHTLRIAGPRHVDTGLQRGVRIQYDTSHPDPPLQHHQWRLLGQLPDVQRMRLGQLVFGWRPQSVPRRHLRSDDGDDAVELGVQRHVLRW